jgi:uncharacterized protein YdaU (DUF1376 family)
MANPNVSEQANEPLPYYKWLWRDWRANRKVQRMSWQARGLYRELLDEFWSEGIIPDDLSRLADICGCSTEEMKTYWPEIVPCWVRVDGGYSNAKMERQRTAKDAERLAKARAGRGGGLLSNSRTRAAQADSESSQAIDSQAQATAEQAQATAEQLQARAEQVQASAEQVQADAEELQASADIAEQSISRARAKQEQEHTPPSPAATGFALTRQQQAELVYEAFPRKVGKAAALKSIEKALSAVKKAGETDPAAYLLARIRGWIVKRERDQTAGAFVPECPNPATWFNQERYDDPDNAPRPVVVFEPVDAETFWKDGE